MDENTFTKVTNIQFPLWTTSYLIIYPGEETRANILRSLQGDYIWIEPISGREFDVAIGARVISAEGRRIQVKDDDNKVLQ